MEKMLKSLMLGAGVAVAGGITALAMPNIAHAQSGSRLCGLTAPTPTGYIGYLYEARQDDVDYTSNCNDATNSYIIMLKSNGDLDKYAWHQWTKEPCENVGVYFESSNSGKDMCDNMKANQDYTVTKDKASNKTTYQKF